MNTINRLFSVEDQLHRLETSSRRVPVKLKQYKELLEGNSEYPSIHKMNQFQIIMKTFTEDGNMEYLVRLVLIIQYTLKRKNSSQLLNFFLKNMNVPRTAKVSVN
jgi:hypothetical protein